MTYSDLLNEFDCMTDNQRDDIINEILKHASPADILDGLYMQKVAVSKEQLEWQKKKFERDVKKYKNDIKNMFKPKDKSPMREVGDSVKFDKLIKPIRKYRKALKAGAIAGGIGAAGAIIGNAQKEEKKAFAMSLIDELYKVAKIAVPDKKEADNENKSLQDDIECEVCEFKGQPTYDGLCPNCGALGGIKPKDEFTKATQEDQREWGDPYQGMSVEEADYLGRVNDTI